MRKESHTHREPTDLRDKKPLDETEDLEGQLGGRGAKYKPIGANEFSSPQMYMKYIFSFAEESMAKVLHQTRMTPPYEVIKREKLKKCHGFINDGDGVDMEEVPEQIRPVVIELANTIDKLMHVVLHLSDRIYHQHDRIAELNMAVRTLSRQAHGVPKDSEAFLLVDHGESAMGPDSDDYKKFRRNLGTKKRKAVEAFREAFTPRIMEVKGAPDKERETDQGRDGGDVRKEEG